MHGNLPDGPSDGQKVDGKLTEDHMDARKVDRRSSVRKEI